MEYYINYHTGVGDEWFEGDLEDAMEAAESGVCYTQQNVTIETYDGNEFECVAKLPWCGCAPEDEDDVLIDYGSFGYYGQWIEY